MHPEPTKVAIVGLGLMGASLAMALKGKTNYKVAGWTRKCEVRKSLKEKSLLHETSDDVRDVISGADITVLCLPVPQISQYCLDLAKCWKKGSVVTDVGSVKKPIIDRVQDVLAENGVEFVGSHPMAGTEKSGADAALPDLYTDAVVFIVPSKYSSHDAVSKVWRLWEDIDTKVFEMDAADHDHVLACTSHLSHVVAWALALAALGDDNPETARKKCLAASSGFRDTSRIASSSPKMWREIIQDNEAAVIESLEIFDRQWETMKKLIIARDFDAFEKLLEQGKSLRDNWLEFKSSLKSSKPGPK